LKGIIDEFRFEKGVEIGCRKQSWAEMDMNYMPRLLEKW
jgi:hypothetical protein